MGVITGSSKNSFVSAEQIYSKVKRDLKSFVGAGLIDDGEFPTYTWEVLSELGISAMKEAEAIKEIINCKTTVPSDLIEIHSIYKCSPCNTSKSSFKGQGKNIIREDVTCEVLGVKDNCSICCENDERIIKKITTEMFVNDSCSSMDYINPILLRLSPNVKARCSEECLNLISTAPYEITINDGYFYTNFDNDCIYIKYYAMPLDCDGIPMVPDVHQVKKAIELYIKYQVLLGMWYDSSVSDISNKWQKAEQDYLAAMGECRYLLKLPSFSTLINEARNKRTNSITNFFSKQYNR